MSFHETLRRLAVFDESLAEAGVRSGQGQTSALAAKTVALLQVAVSVAIGSAAVCLEWSATKDEITDVLLAIAPVAAPMSARCTRWSPETHPLRCGRSRWLVSSSSSSRW